MLDFRMLSTAKSKIIALISLVGIVLIAIFQQGFYSKDQESLVLENVQPTTSVTITDDTPHLVSTSPSPLQNAVVAFDQTVSMTFSQPIVNIDEFKYRFEPKATYKTKLSDDRKTVIFTPNPTWELGQTYSIGVDVLTKFDSGIRLREGVGGSFKTIDYKGV